MSKRFTVIAVAMVIATGPLGAATAATKPILYRTIQQDRTGWLTFLPDSRTLICGHRDGTASRYNIATGNMDVEINFGMDAISYTHADSWIYALSSQGFIQGANATTLEMLRSYYEKPSNPESIWASADGRWLLVKKDPGFGGSPILSASRGGVVGFVRDLPAGAAFSPDLRYAAYRRGSRVFITDTRFGTIQRRISLGGATTRRISLMFSPNGRTRVVTSPSGFPGHRGSAGFTVAVASGRTRWMPAWQPSAARITSALGRWEIASAVPIGMSTYRRRAAELADMPWSLEDVQGLAFSPNGRWMAICGPDGTIRVYRLRG